MADARAARDRYRLLVSKLMDLHGSMLIVLLCIAGIGFAMLYSVSSGDFGKLAGRQMVVFAAGFACMVAIALVHIKWWWKLSYAVYGVGLLMLIAVEIIGDIGGGAQRWLDLGFVRLQPSEIMKIGLVMALARYYHGLTLEEVRKMKSLITPALLIGMPSVLVVLQPDLGTMILIAAAGATLLFVAGVPRKVFFVGAVLAVAAAVGGFYQLHDYQRDRVFTFLDPDSDPLGTGYHIQQSKIALGSGGVSGKGFMQGTQSHLDFLPEKQTDFIFTALAEEFGFVGGVTLVTLYAVLIGYGFLIALSARNHFARLMAVGVTTTFFLYAFINIAMVMGLIPVVGVPLPLVSYGGSAMMTLLIGMGLLMNVYVHRNVVLSRQGTTPLARQGTVL
ncbi:rod shape-determining protein RodA [Emcibacter sp. SYSU 3D8]|uniref:rod shape-determining protein RodA n=1 Tax=Emcibacter sp. SYSU 3D8 TaxID=3133969 RepID=UPI0031FE6528